jgi:hypothetical protein
MSTPTREFLIFDYLAEHGDDALEEADRQIKAVIAKVREHEGAGTLTLKLSLKPAKKYGALEVDVAVSSKAPSKPSKPRLVYANDDNELVTEDPAQMKLQLEKADAPNIVPILKATNA